MKFAMLPNQWEEAAAELTQAGHEQVELQEADFLVFNGTPKQFPELPANLKYVQLALAGVDAFGDAGLLDSSVRWANAGGLYAKPVAESTIAMLLALLHRHVPVTRARTWDIRPEIDFHPWLHNNQTVAVVGAGGIGKQIIAYLKPFGPHIIAVNNSGREVEGADEVVRFADVEQVWPRADIVIQVAPLTKETAQMMNAEVFAALPDHAVLVNVGRGPLVDTDALVTALEQGIIAGAALDVTDPEPLPDDHPLWQMDNVLITPHTANTTDRMQALSGALYVENARLFEAGEDMKTEVDVTRGY